MAGSMFCGRCGAQAAEEGDLYCRECGARLTWSRDPEPLGLPRPPRGFVYSRWFTLLVPLFAIVVIGGAASLAFGPVTRELVTQAFTPPTPTETSTPIPTETPTPTATPVPTARPVPTATPRPAPTAWPTPARVPTPSVYKGPSVGPVKIEAGDSYPVQLGYLGRGTRIQAILSVDFNSRLSYLTGSPDIDVHIVHAEGIVTSWRSVGDGFALSWTAPGDGRYALLLSNSRSAVTAKRIGVEFGTR